MNDPKGEIPADTLAQLQSLTLDPTRPLIITDADEVLLKFMQRVEHYLETLGLWIDLSSFALSTNIKSRETNESVQVPTLIDDFFASQTPYIEAADGAADTLSSLSEHAQIIVLTNLPAAHREARIENLKGHGMAYPVVVNSGLKGPAAKWLADKTTGPVFFLDDIPHNITSVAEHAPDVNCIHFIADPRLAKLISKAKGATARIDIWAEAHDFISGKIADHASR
ncbi:MAG: hypothetical protein P8I95_02080 [Alphaproteobacteria bacterium]|nr:hypothetical protein [Alphaproteobacteria bacterium]